MRTPREIYAEYRIMPNLQLHQLRVAAVAQTICENFQGEIDTQRVVTACLFHDMGNIIKFKLDYFPGAVEPEGLLYWEGIKKEFIEKYGMDHHAANILIARELGLSESVVECIDGIGFSKVPAALEGSSFEKKICEYSDGRVAPYGVTSLQERLEDGRKRYLNREGVKADVAGSLDDFAQILKLEHELEAQIFAKSRITPGDITNERIGGTVDKLRDFPVQ